MIKPKFSIGDRVNVIAPEFKMFLFDETVSSVRIEKKGNQLRCGVNEYGEIQADVVFIEIEGSEYAFDQLYVYPYIPPEPDQQTAQVEESQPVEVVS